MRTALSIASLAPKVISGRMAETWGRSRPASPLRVPGSPGLLTDAWLTDALCRDVPGAHVVSHALGRADHGTTSRRPLTVTYDDHGTAAGLPTQLFTKSAATFGTRMVSASMGMGTLETGFYRDVRPGLAIEAPVARAAAHDPRSHRMMLILDDVTATRGATFASVRTARLDRSAAEQLIDVLASLHSSTWDARPWRWLPDAGTWLRRADRAIGLRARCRSGLRRAADVLPGELSRHGADIPRLLLESVDAAPAVTLRHGDVHLGNWYRTHDGARGLADWQCVTRGSWAHDLAYALAACLEPDDRRAWEAGLVARYSERLAESGITPQGDPFTAYRAATLHGLFMWLATIGRFPGQPRLQPDDVTLATLHRLGLAVAELETIALLKR